MAPPAQQALTLRAATASDRSEVARITAMSGLFRDDEIAVALEVFDAALAGDASYTVVIAQSGERAAGWICWGATPCTVGTYDMYWLAIDPALHGAGIGSQLVADMERRVSGKGRLIVVETAGRPDYAPTRAFYEAKGYTRAATIPGYYAPDDDLVVYTKRLDTRSDS